jgi:hypothetical protein
MAAKTYTVLNGSLPGATAVTPISTGTAIKTMFQVLTLAGFSARVVEWWTEFDGSAAATPIRVEVLMHTGGPQTTLTTYAAADFSPANDPQAPTASLFSLASNTSGFGTGGTEVTPTTVRNIATHLVPPTSGIYIQYPLGREPEMQANVSYLRHRTTAGASVNCYAGATLEL